MRRSLALLVLLHVCPFLPPGAAAAASIPSGSGRLEFRHGGRVFPVWTHLPATASVEARIVFVHHGVGRNGAEYRDQWVATAERDGFLLVVPEFTREAFPGQAYILGGPVDEGGLAPPREAWSFGVLEPLFDFIRAARPGAPDTYFLYGHSAGAQFVHRFLFLVPEARVERAVMANAGWYTLPDGSVAYPYGLKGTPARVDDLRACLGRRFLVLLGTEDVDPAHPSLSRTAGAMAQGPHRRARGENFFAAARARSAELGGAFGWTLAYAPGIAHSNAGMAPFAADWLFRDRFVAAP